MNFEVIETLRLVCAGFVTDIEKEYIHLPAADERFDAFSRAVKEGRGEDLEELCMAVASEHESQGFVNGFRLGVRLMLESLSPQGRETGRKGGGRHENGT